MRRAAGILFVHQGRLLKRTDGRWGLPGGKAEHNESPAACARREFEEECGAVYPGKLVPWHREEGPSVDYRTLIAYPTEAFEPQLNDEHTEWRWCGRHELRPMLHPGIIPALRKLWPPMAKDAKPNGRRKHPLQPHEQTLRPIPVSVQAEDR